MDVTQTDQQKPEILAVRTLAQTAVFEIQALDLRFSNGCERTYERLTPARKSAVMVLPIDDGDLLMVREYAAATERYELTLVKGLIDAGESPEAAALRELQEEIGFGARRLTALRTLYTSPSHMYSPLTVFVATHFYHSQLPGDEPEPLQLVRVPLAKLDELIDNPHLGDARVLAALMLLQKRLPEIQAAS